MLTLFELDTVYYGCDVSASTLVVLVVTSTKNAAGVAQPTKITLIILRKT